jgi:predicted lipoprotein with Yx(FWY)xxD motif
MFSGDSFPTAGMVSPLLQFHCTAANTTTRFSTGKGGIGCTTPWPPLMSSGALLAGPGVSQAGLSTAGATSGFTPGQVEYFGHPLYTFVRDKAPGEFTGEDVSAFGGIFWLVSPDGLPAPGHANLGTEASAAGTVLSTMTASGVRTLYVLSYDGSSLGAGPPGPGIGHPGEGASVLGQPTCTTASGCSAVWPPLLTAPGRPMLGPGVDPRLVGEIRRPDGTVQVTYGGWPVYQFFADLAPGAAPGETNGEYFLDDLADGVWYTISPDGLPQPGQATLTVETDGLLAVSSSAFPPLNPVATVYTLSADTNGTSTCLGLCAKFWPPVLTSGPPKTTGLSATQASEVGTVQRPDGTSQVTYAGKPLYLFSHLLTAGDADGASIPTPFGTFSVVKP